MRRTAISISGRHRANTAEAAPSEAKLLRRGVSRPGHLGHRILAAGTDLVRVAAQAHHRFATFLVRTQRLHVRGASLPDSVARGLLLRRGSGLSLYGGAQRTQRNEQKRADLHGILLWIGRPARIITAPA